MSAPDDMEGVTTSQQRHTARHAVPSAGQDVAPAPVVPSQREAVTPRPAVCRTPSVRRPGQPLTVGEYAERADAAVDVTGPQFGEWPYGRPATPAPAQGNGVGRAALVCGALGLLVALAPFVRLIPSAAGLPVLGLPLTDLAAFPLVVVGLVLGVLGTDRTAGHRTVATVGTALATAGLALCVLWTTLLIITALVSPASSGDALTALTSGNSFPVS